MEHLHFSLGKYILRSKLHLIFDSPFLMQHHVVMFIAESRLMSASRGGGGSLIIATVLYFISFSWLASKILALIKYFIFANGLAITYGFE